MKKIALFFLLLAFCSYTFAQQWIGNTDASNMVMLENSEFAIAPKHIQADAQPAVCSVFPNPTQDVVKVIAENTIQTVTVFDVFGKQVRAFDVDAAHATLPMADLPAGTYILKMQTADDIFTRKIVKQ